MQRNLRVAYAAKIGGAGRKGPLLPSFSVPNSALDYCPIDDGFQKVLTTGQADWKMKEIAFDIRHNDLWLRPVVVGVASCQPVFGGLKYEVSRTLVFLRTLLERGDG